MSRIGFQYALTALTLIQTKASEGEHPDAGVLLSLNAGLAHIVNEPSDSEIAALSSLIGRLFDAAPEEPQEPENDEGAAGSAGEAAPSSEAGAIELPAETEAPSAGSVVPVDGAEAPPIEETPVPTGD